MVIMMIVCTLTTTNDQSWGIISRNELRRTVLRFGESLSINIKPSPICAEITGTLLPRNILQILFLLVWFVNYKYVHLVNISQFFFFSLDNFIRGLVEKGKFNLVEQLLLDGYTEFQPIIDKLSSETQTEEVKNFLQSIPQVQVSLYK